MKNQYVGDINDYHKYGLIKIFNKIAPNEKIYFVWMLTKNINNNEGGNIDYLNEPEKYRNYDSQLFDDLESLVKQKKRDISEIQVLKYFNSNGFYSKELLDNLLSREEYFDELIEETKKFNIIFFDPDNGIERKSYKRGNKFSSKYLYWQEIETFWKLNKDILLYQHFPHEPRYEFTLNLKETIEQKLENARVLPIISGDVLFIYITRHSRKRIENITNKLMKNWKNEFEILHAIATKGPWVLYKGRGVFVNKNYNDKEVKVNLIEYWPELDKAYTAKWGYRYIEDLILINEKNIDTIKKNNKYAEIGKFYGNIDSGIFTYVINKSGDSVGFNTYTKPISSEIDCDLKIITREDILQISINKKEISLMEYCNIGNKKSDLLGYYYDNKGNIYYITTNDQINKFAIKINSLKIIY
jgi:hypothetical protein